MAKLVENGMPESSARSTLSELDLEVVPFDTDLALLAGALRPRTKPIGMSLGDRACIAFGMRLSLPVLTADRNWQALASEVQIQIIR